ncbi:hypothetical protein BJ508DRAFT_171267 [Ascobolus immersus RN42]|uniref:Uncharacterized protein n=1 Tax=Ascobolus immersus RN42 TaxID=1160509 RepID=A0A3N4HWC3_ASCIM|nr:hypothetical protein BJ508DRAFT_171267 [Ascobolus immersus RN42]
MGKQKQLLPFSFSQAYGSSAQARAQRQTNICSAAESRPQKDSFDLTSKHDFPPLPTAFDSYTPRVRSKKKGDGLGSDSCLTFNNRTEMLQMYDQMKELHGVTDELEAEYRKCGFIKSKQDWVERRLSFLRKNGFRKLPTSSEYMEWLWDSMIPESQDFDECNPGVIAYFDSMSEEEFNACRYEG